MTLPTESDYTETQGTGYNSSLSCIVPTFSVGQLATLVCCNSSNSDDPRFNAITGWTKHVEVGDASNDTHEAFYSRVIDGTEGWTAGVSTVTITTVFNTYIVVRFSVWDDCDGVHLLGSEAGGVGTSLALPSITTTVDDCHILGVGGHDGNDGTPSVSGTGWSMLTSLGFPDASSSGCQLILGEKTQATSGATGDCTIANTVSDGFSGVQVALEGTGGLTAALTGTATASIVESDIVTGGKTVIATITGDTFVTAGASFDAQRAAISNGLTASTSQSNGFNNQVSLAVTDCVRTSSTVCTITLPATAGYDIASQEILEWVIPASALVGGVAVTVSPTFTIDPISGSIITRISHHLRQMRQ